MISKDDIPHVLIEACPSFEESWMAFRDEWKEESNPPIYLALAKFSRHVIEMLANHDVSQFPRIFNAIERMHIEGDEYVKEAATVGILESLQNTNLHTSTEPEQFRRYLRPVSAKWWDKLYEFWEHGKLLTDD